MEYLFVDHCQQLMWKLIRYLAQQQHQIVVCLEEYGQNGHQEIHAMTHAETVEQQPFQECAFHKTTIALAVEVQQNKPNVLLRLVHSREQLAVELERRLSLEEHSNVHPRTTQMHHHLLFVQLIAAQPLEVIGLNGLLEDLVQQHVDRVRQLLNNVFAFLPLLVHAKAFLRELSTVESLFATSLMILAVLDTKPQLAELNTFADLSQTIRVPMHHTIQPVLTIVVLKQEFGLNGPFLQHNAETTVDHVGIKQKQELVLRKLTDVLAKE